MMKNATDWLGEWQENDHVYICQIHGLIYGSCISWKKRNKRDAKNNYKQKKIHWRFWGSVCSQMSICRIGVLRPIRTGLFSWRNLCLFPHSQSGLASHKVLSFWLSGSLFTGNEDTDWIWLLLQSMCSPCVTLLCFSADSSGKRWGLYSSAVPVEVSLL